MRPSALAAGLGAGRALFGVALLAMPARFTRVWVGADDAPTTVLMRCVAGRDIALGLGQAVAAVRGNDTARWVAAGILADATDAAVTVAAGDRIPRNGRLATAAIGGGAAFFGVCLVRKLD
jgi:hypothetical protein